MSPENGDMKGTYNYFPHSINFEVLDVLGCSMTDGESHWAFAQMVVSRETRDDAYMWCMPADLRFADLTW